MTTADEDAILRDLFRTSAILSRKSRERGASRHDIILGNLTARESLIAEGTCSAPFTQSKLAEIMGITSQALGEMLVKMEEDGLVVRHASENDRRSIYVELTDTGREASRTIIDDRQKFAQEALASLTKDERRQLASIMRKLNSAL